MNALADLLPSLGTGLSQHARLFTLTSAQPGGLPETLMAERFRGTEAINELFSFDVDALSVSTNLDLTQFIGEELTIALQQPDGSRRAWHGVCTEASWQGADGGVARYRLRLQPALALLALRIDSYIFQDMNVRDVVTELLSDYPQVRFDFDITQELRQRALITQYRESDLAFIARILASEGLNWRFEHDQASDDDASDGHSRHRLVIFDSKAKVPAMPGNATIRFHGVRASDTDDAIDTFHARRRTQANAVSISSWDPAGLVAPAAEQFSSLDAGELPALSIYDGSGERIASLNGEAEPHSILMLQALEMDNKLFEGAGAVRRLAAGHAFELAQHERYGSGDNHFTVLTVSHRARNNLGAQIKAASDGTEPGTYRNDFTCVRDVVALVPRAIAASTPNTAMGPQTAIVVGLADAVSTTQRDHCVRVQFPWQRGRRPNPGGMEHSADPAGSAPGDATSGAWVRVSEALAGPNWGTQFSPRIGTEVLVDFIEGDIDRPVVVAQLYTGADLPPFSAGVDSDANHGGALSGIHSHNVDGSGFNQLQLDDTRSQLRTRLATSTAATQLNLGYLISQPLASAYRGQYRGSGFELRTDAWGVIRGGDGVLLSTTARMQQGIGITSSQMDAAEAVSLMKGARDLVERFDDAAAQSRAITSSDAGRGQKDFINLLDPTLQGKYKCAVNGQEASKTVSGSRESDHTQPVEKFGAPVVAFESATTISSATPGSTVIYAGEQLQWTTQGDMHFAAQCTLSTIAAEATGFFAPSGGIQAVAANGPVSIQAHTDAMALLADSSVTIVSASEGIEIKAQQKIVLSAGSASITLDGVNITFACPGAFTVKGASHHLTGGSKVQTSFEKLPDGRLKLFDEAFVIKDADGRPVADLAYRIQLPDGTVESGVTDEKGQTHLVSSASRDELVIFIDEDSGL